MTGEGGGGGEDRGTGHGLGEMTNTGRLVNLYPFEETGNVAT